MRAQCGERLTRVDSELAYKCIARLPLATIALMKVVLEAGRKPGPHREHHRGTFKHRADPI